MSEVSEATSLEATGEDATSEITNDEGATSETFVGTYRTKEDAEQGLAEKDRYIKELKERIDQSQRETSRDEILSKMADKLEAVGQPQAPQIDPQELLSKYASEIDEKGGEAVVGLFQEFMGIKEREEADKLQALASERDTKIAELEKRLQDFDPRFIANSEKVRELEQLGVNREVAIQIADKYLKTPEQPARPDLPGTMGGGRTGSDGVKALPKESVDAMNAAMASMGLPPMTKDEEQAHIARERAKGRV